MVDLHEMVMEADLQGSDSVPLRARSPLDPELHQVLGPMEPPPSQGANVWH